MPGEKAGWDLHCVRGKTIIAVGTANRVQIPGESVYISHNINNIRKGMYFPNSYR